MTQAEHISIPYFSQSETYFTRLAQLPQRVWLDSGKPLSTYGRFDILTASPRKTLVNPSTEELDNKVEELRSEAQTIIEAHPDLPFHGGAIGYFNYEYRHAHFNIPANPNNVRPSVFGIFDWAIIQDHKEKQSHLIFLSGCSACLREKIKTLVEQSSRIEEKAFCVEALGRDLDKHTYLRHYETIQRHIHDGDTYQINFAQRFRGRFKGAPDKAYTNLRQYMPSPFSAYLELDVNDSILSFSPERFIQVENGLAITQPIKGTIARGLTPEEDQRNAQTLENSEKNRAENLMIVDLLRNDFSQACEPHSVKTPKLFALESFANVHHLVSTVEGKLDNTVSPLSFLLKCFPGGSITGAPKKRAMEIIDSLEDHPRNIYCGSICYMSTSGRLDSNIAIRTLLVSNDQIFCWGGGGIVADSTGEEEYAESLQKVGVLLEALKQEKR